MRPRLLALALPLLLAFILSVVGPEPAHATVGSMTTSRIGPVDAYHSFTASTWNPHMPKMATYNGWVYAIIDNQRDDGTHYSIRVATVYKRKTTGTTWYSTGRTVTGFNNAPGMTIDRAGRFILSFGCDHLSVNCVPGGASGFDKYFRFYALVFTAKNADGSFNLANPPQYTQSNEYTESNCGYNALSTDPSSTKGNSYATLSFDDVEPQTCDSAGGKTAHQWLFNLRTSTPTFLEVPRSPWGDRTEYAQLAISPQGTRYVTGADYVNTPGSTFKYGGFVLSRWTNQTINIVKSDHITTPSSWTVYGDKFLFPYDMAYGPDGRLYVLFGKEDGSCTDVLWVETARNSGVFNTKAAGCHDFWAQLQVSSAGHIFILEDSYRVNDALADASKVPRLYVNESDDGGTTWTPHTYTFATGATNSFPAGTNDDFQPFLTKPWTDPGGFNADVLHGYISNEVRVGGYPSGTSYSNSTVEYTIPVN